MWKLETDFQNFYPQIPEYPVLQIPPNLTEQQQQHPRGGGAAAAAAAAGSVFRDQHGAEDLPK